MKKLFQTVFLMIMGVATIVVGTTAYFNAQAVSPDNVFAAGTLDVQLSQTSTTSWPDWSPGELRQIEFSVTNSGSLPVYVKGFFDGTWSGGLSDLSLISVESVERNKAGVWEALINSSVPLASEFYYGLDGSEMTQEVLNAGETVTLRVGVKLSETTGNDYQGGIFTGQLHLAARQVTAGATWPSLY